MRAAVLDVPGAAAVLTDVELDAPMPTEVLIRMAAAGVCHTDFSALTGLMEFPTPCGQPIGSRPTPPDPPSPGQPRKPQPQQETRRPTGETWLRSRRTSRSARSRAGSRPTCSRPTTNRHRSTSMTRLDPRSTIPGARARTVEPTRPSSPANHPPTLRLGLASGASGPEEMSSCSAKEPRNGSVGLRPCLCVIMLPRRATET
jgi:hypothetical protein